MTKRRTTTRTITLAAIATGAIACSRALDPQPTAEVPPATALSLSQGPATAAASTAAASTTAMAAPGVPGPHDPSLDSDFLAIANAYPSLTRADGTWWAPENCRAPIDPAFVSKAEGGPHGRKIYTLFVKDYGSYTALSGPRQEAKLAPGTAPALAKMAQVIVKQAWAPVPSATFREKCPSPSMHSYLADVVMDGTAFRACEPAGLFIMYKPDAASASTTATDDGWLYGTVEYEHDAKGLTPRVTAAGRVASCMGCHDKAPHGRLFGLATAK